MSIATDLVAIADIKDDLKTAIEGQGVTVGSAPFADYPDLVSDIGAGVAPDSNAQVTWTKPSGWPDLAAIFAASTMPNKRYAVLFMVANDTWSAINMGGSGTGGSTTYETSDGATYNTNNITHTWNPAFDIDGGDGTKLRWLIVGNNNSTGLAFQQMAGQQLTTWTPVWVYAGSGTYTSMPSLGNASASSANKHIRCFEIISPAAITGSTFSGTFDNCDNLECMRWRTASTTTVISATWTNCIKLTELTIPSTVTSFTGVGMFNGCRMLRFEMPPTLATISGSNPFATMNNLNKLDIPTTLTSVASGAFISGAKIKTITVFPSMVTGSNVLAGNLFLEEVVFRSGSYTTIGDQFCNQNQALKSITIPSGVTTIGNSAFSSCTRLASVTLPSGLTTLGSSVFSNCVMLREITLPSSITSIGSGCFNQTAIKTLVIPSSITTLFSETYVPFIKYQGNVTAGTVTSHNSSTLLGISFGQLDVALNISNASQQTRGALVDLYTCLKNNVGIVNRTLTIGGTNISRTTTTDRAIATAKNWTLA